MRVSMKNLIISKYTWCLSALLFSSIGVHAQLGGLTSFNAFNIPGSARMAAMGGNFIAAKDGDLHLAAFNPALLDSTLDGALGLSYVNYFDGINLGYAAYAQQIKPRWTALASMQFAGYGKQTELDPLGNEIGSFNAGEYALTLGSGYQVDSLWSIGANLKTIYGSLAGYTSLALALDASAVYHVPKKNFTATFLVRNMGAQIVAYQSGDREKLPFELQIGISKKPAHAPFRFSVMYDNMQQWNLDYEDPTALIVRDPITGEILEEGGWVFGDRLMRHLVFGTEFLFGDKFSIRLGYNYRRRKELSISDKPGMAGFSYGFGVKISRFQLSYGRSIFHLAGPAHHLSITTNLNRFGKI
ncbi:MAG: hypothetical protein RLZZ262_28 [Bacteroidota bacterium]|jgi:hypothetical protein